MCLEKRQVSQEAKRKTYFPISRKGNFAIFLMFQLRFSENDINWILFHWDISALCCGPWVMCVFNTFSFPECDINLPNIKTTMWEVRMFYWILYMLHKSAKLLMKSCWRVSNFYALFSVYINSPREADEFLCVSWRFLGAIPCYARM
jgi:hypothetical protein